MPQRNVILSTISQVQRLLVRAAVAELREPGSGMPDVQRAMEVVSAGERYLDLQGRAGLIKSLGLLRRGRRYASEDVLPLNVTFGQNAPTFEQATQDLIDRVPMLVPAGETTSDVYGRDHAFALARSVHKELTSHVQDAVREVQAASMAGGAASSNVAAAAKEAIIDLLLRGRISRGEAGAGLRGWTDNYAETVLRTNLSTAHAAGQWQELSQPHIRKLIPALRYDATGDADTRPNHEAINGLILPVDHDWWNIYSPPNGFNCRCALIYLDANRLRRMGLLDASGRVKPVIPPGVTGSQSGEGYPDVIRSQRSGKVWRFDRGRPDRAIYGTS